MESLFGWWQKNTDKDVKNGLETVERGGEILITSIDNDGTKKGFDIDCTKMWVLLASYQSL